MDFAPIDFGSPVDFGLQAMGPTMGPAMGPAPGPATGFTTAPPATAPPATAPPKPSSTAPPSTKVRMGFVGTLVSALVELSLPLLLMAFTASRFWKGSKLVWGGVLLLEIYSFVLALQYLVSGGLVMNFLRATKGGRAPPTASTFWKNAGTRAPGDSFLRHLWRKLNGSVFLLIFMVTVPWMLINGWLGLVT